MKRVGNTRLSIGNVLLEKSRTVFSKFLDLNTTNIGKYIFIFPTEDKK